MLLMHILSVYVTCMCQSTTVWSSMLLLNMGLRADAAVKFHQIDC